MPATQGLVWDLAAAQPRRLPDGWEERRSATKDRAYYFEKATGRTTWIRPTASTAADAGAGVCPVASVDDAIVPESILELLSAGSFPALLKATTPAGSVVVVKVPTGYPGAGAFVSVLVPADAPADGCFWIVAPCPDRPLPKSASCSSAKSSTSSSAGSAAAGSAAAGSAATTVVRDFDSVGSATDWGLEMEGSEEEGWDFERHEQQVRALARVARAARGSPDSSHLAPEQAAAPAMLISRTPSPEALVCDSAASNAAQKVGNPFTTQLRLLRREESHNESLINAASLLSGWEKRMSVTKGKPYYYNQATGATSWVRPTA